MAIKLLPQSKSLRDKKVLLRADLNVPVKNGRVQDDFKLLQSLPTIQRLLKAGAGVVLVSHLGRPKGQDKKLSLRPIKNYLEEALEEKIKLVPLSKLKRASVKSGEVVLLENIRFSPDEANNTGSLAQDLAGLADLFLLDGFAVSHRPSASVVGVGQHLPSYAGPLMAKEIAGLSKVMSKPKKPLMVVLGGAKVETKIPVLRHLLPLANKILLGGSIVNTYLWAQGKKVGKSLVDKDFKKQAVKYCRKSKVILPVDLVVGTPDGKKAEIVALDKKFSVPNNKGIYDIGPATVSLYAKHIKNAQTLVWNGAMGHFEQSPYQYGTEAVTGLLAARSKGKAFGICGGGETTEVLKKLDLMDDVDLVSTGGGAMLEFLSGKKLPGVKIVSS